jgi:hypothetical protein
MAKSLTRKVKVGFRVAMATQPFDWPLAKGGSPISFVGANI